MRRILFLALTPVLVAMVFGQGMPHFLTGTIQRAEGMLVPDECMYITIDVDGEVHYIVPDSTNFDAGVGRWYLMLDAADAGDPIEVRAIDSCWFEDGTQYGIISDSFSTDLGLLTLTPLGGLRPYLYDAAVVPAGGYIEELFRFDVFYESDPWNRPPNMVELYIDYIYFGTAHAQDPFDSEYRDGAQFFLTLMGTDIGRGEHNFFFFTEDVMGFPAWSETLNFVVLNHPPVLSGASISASSSPATEASILTCIPGTATDSEGDPITIEYDWFVNGISIGVHSNTLDGTYFNKHDEVFCIATPFDGYDYGLPISTPTITIMNTPPGVAEIAIDPAEPFDFEDISAVIVTDAVDIDGDVVAYQYRWHREGIYVTGGATLDDMHTMTGENWTLTVTANDGEATGVAAELDFTIGGPVLLDGRVEPLDGHPGTTAFTYFVTYFNSRNYAPTIVNVDIDGVIYDMVQFDAMDVDYTDGALFFYTTTLTWGEHQFRFAAIDDHGDISASMDYIPGPEMTNAPPVIDEVSIVPYPAATELDIIAASVVAWHDDDGDDAFFLYQWYVNGEPLVDATTPTLTGDDFAKGDEVSCQITPYDAYGTGTPVNTEPVTIINAAPYAEGAEIIVTPAGVANELSTLTAQLVGAGEPDGDALFYTMVR